MIVRAIIDALLSDTGIAGIVGEEIHPGAAPDAAPYPFLVVSLVGGPPEYTLAGRAGITRARIQIDVCTLAGYAAKEDLTTAVRNFMDERPVWGAPCAIDQVQCINEFDSPAAAQLAQTERAGPRTWRRILEFYVWHRLGS